MTSSMECMDHHATEMETKEAKCLDRSWRVVNLVTWLQVDLMCQGVGTLSFILNSVFIIAVYENVYTST